MYLDIINNEKLSGESLSVPVQPDLLPLATMPDQTTNTDEQRVPDRTVQDVISASLEPTKIIHIEGTVGMMPITSSKSTENANDFPVVKDHDEFFDVESELPNEITKADVTPTTVAVEKPAITLAEAEKLQHDAAIEQKDDDFYEPELDLTLTKVPTIIEGFISIENKINSLTSSPITTIIKNTTEDVSVGKSKNNKEKKTTVITQQPVANKKSKSVNNKTSTALSTPVEYNGMPVIVEQTTMDKQTTSGKNNKKEQTIIEKLSSVELIDQKKNSQIALPQINITEIPSLDPPIPSVQQEFVRPKFSFRLKPTITVNEDDQLKLEVHFIGHPEPKVKEKSFHIFFHHFFLSR